MSKFKGTPGPWLEKGIGQIGSDFRMVCDIYLHGGKSGAIEDAANGQLIRAAHDLLDLAGRVVEIFQPMQDKGQNGQTFQQLLDRAKAAIAKAGGTT